MANAKNSDLAKCYMFEGVKYGSCADDPDAEVPDELQERLEEAGVLGDNAEKVAEDEGRLFDGLPNKAVQSLKSEGYEDVVAINNATVDELTSVDNVGQRTAETLKARAGAGTGQNV